jgi:predicted nucleotidyltransferase
MTPSNSPPPSSPATLDLEAERLARVREILAAHVPGVEVRAFGSRVTGTSVPTSDLDLVLVAPERLSLRALRTLEEAFEDSDLPMRVDVVEWQRLSSEFRAAIDRASVVVQAGASS